MKKFNVKKYGVKADGVTLVTEAVQKVIDLASEAKDTFVYFPRGKYVLGTLHLKDDTHILLGRGSQLLGSLNFNDYERDEKVDYPLYQDASHSFFHCSMFVGENVKRVTITGKGTIDMRSVWDEANVRNFVGRGAKAIALKECEDIYFSSFKLLNATDLGIYLAGCSLITIRDLKLKVHIDGISPDNCKDCYIDGCQIESGDDGIVIKSSYTLNKLGKNEKIIVTNCDIKSRCNAIKIGTETNGEFNKILFDGIQIHDTRIAGIALESVDGSNIDGVSFKNISMKNVGSPLFVHLGKRLRGPEGTQIGSIKNIVFQNIIAIGPYKVYETIPWNYDSFKANSFKQFPGFYSKDVVPEKGTWQITSNVSGLIEKPLENITFRNCYFELDGGVEQFAKEVIDEVPPVEPSEENVEGQSKEYKLAEDFPDRNEKKYAQPYPEVNMFGKVLPAVGIYFRHIKGLKMDYVVTKTRFDDKREKYVFDDVSELKTNTVY